MCIIAFITNCCERFPFVLINNRDELLDRFTHPLALDPATGLLWAVDGVAGGSWLGINVFSGRLATVTNCRRVPSAPLMGRPVTATGWRGAAPLEESLRYTTVAKAVGVDGVERKTLVYDPPTSRGTIIKEFLHGGDLPRVDGTCGTGVPPSLQPPYYAGYNLLTCESVFGKPPGKDTTPFSMEYTSNRFYAPHRQTAQNSTVHCLQNTFIDNWAEPKSRLLRDLFQEQLDRTLLPLRAGQAVDAKAVASQFADHCLCAQPNFDLLADVRRLEGLSEKSETAEKELHDLRELLHSTNPFSGFTKSELENHFKLSPSDYADSFDEKKISHDVLKEAYLQKNIFVPAQANYGTEMQSMVLVERQPGCEALPIVHFLQRRVQNRENEPVQFDKWVHYTIVGKTVELVE
ncbi:hypothetical protein AGDE_04675 [Angomonas deanei]|nr:hypothetical protein AGDE_12203 [Angomonas deanei]EPY39253.1 hypothetical protein AGDE_04675 [Angomonas deanei]|eukprot:EPY24724.1 hypothetical protein AGDE_12203 [Angomonas deanei]